MLDTKSQTQTNRKPSTKAIERATKRAIDKAELRGFYGGIITALAILKLHDSETQYRDIVEACDVKELVAHARREEELLYSGLVKYGYARKPANELDD